MTMLEKLKKMQEAAESVHGVGVRAYPERVVLDKIYNKTLWSMRFLPRGYSKDCCRIDCQIEDLILPENFTFCQFKTGDKVWAINSQLHLTDFAVEKVEGDYVFVKHYGLRFHYSSVYFNIDEALAALKEKLLAK